MSTAPHAVTLADVSFAWADGALLLDGVSGTFGRGRTGLIGANGAGKSTLLRLIAGELTPTAGSVTTHGRVGHLRQGVLLRKDAQVSDLLGIRSPLDAVRAIEAGSTSPQNYEAVGDRWDIAAEASAALDEAGLGRIDLDRRVGTLSGGEGIAVALIGLRLAEAQIALLDEPTNNLDSRARGQLLDLVADWKRTMIVVSHDVRLLNAMDATADLRDGALEFFGGTYDAYTEHLALEQAAAEQQLRTSEQELRTEKRQRIEAETKLARRQRYAKTDYRNKRKPKTVMRQRATEAQVSAGKHRGLLDDRVEAAELAVAAGESRVRRDVRIHLDLPDPDVPAGRALLRLDAGDFTTELRGPERLALLGDNGVGKTRLLEGLVAGRSPHGTLFTDRVGYLPQRRELADETGTVLAAVSAVAPHRTGGELRSNLARLGLRGEAAERQVAGLSGGERFRVALARLLLAEPPHQLLLLDEPTNDLDLATIDVLVQALEAYRGGLVVVSHDDGFLERLGIGTWIELSGLGCPRFRAARQDGSARSTAPTSPPTGSPR
ncbi:ABC-F family ATP-binding cassette domain-containing protein [Nakamurella alba]|uniref:ABC-F family ATP-binding cassette domain-containing protein n=1 Tax=Nakamurella alba TaxID=2665158 RepID=UPI001E467D8D|nr:ATP-binding cassette domain-containing protein [Nakamurella alba]